MSEDKKAMRKAKSAAKKAAREEKTVLPAQTQSESISQSIADKVNNDIRQKSLETPSFEKPLDRPVQVLSATDMKPSAGVSNTAVSEVPATTQEQVQTPTDTTNTETPQLSAWEQMMKDRRETLKKDKTDAVKMQKYYGLASALKALGDMGATAIGGAIGGNVLDSAPKVEAYQQSKGYIDAFERAKAANEALRRLDDKEFQLKYADEQKNDERAYKAKQDEIARNYQAAQRDDERKYNALVRAEERDYKKQMTLLEHELRKAERAENRAEEERIKKEIIKLNQDHEERMKKYSVDMVKMQMKGKEGEEKPTGRNVLFDDDRVAFIDNDDMQTLRTRYINRKFGDEMITEENFDAFIASHPEIVEKFLKTTGKDIKFMSAPVEKPVVEESVNEEEVVRPSFWQRIASNPQGTASTIIAPNAGMVEQPSNQNSNESENGTVAINTSTSSAKDYNAQFKRK